MAPRISQHSVAPVATCSTQPGHRSFIAKGTFVPKEVWGVFSPLRLLQFDGEQFIARLRTGDSLKGLFHFNESAAQDTLTLAATAGKKLLFTIDDMTLGRQNELTWLKLADATLKTPPFSLFLKR